MSQSLEKCLRQDRFHTTRVSCWFVDKMLGVFRSNHVHILQNMKRHANDADGSILFWFTDSRHSQKLPHYITNNNVNQITLRFFRILVFGANHLSENA